MTEAEIRVATNDEGPEIGKLVWDNGFTVEGIDWTDIAPYWLSARIAEELVGAVQVLPGKPFGRIEILSVRTDLDPIVRARVVGDLLETAMEVVRISGGQIASGLIPFHHKHYKKALKKRGGQVFDSGNILYIRVKDV